MGMLRFMFLTNEPSLPASFYSVVVSISVFKALSTVFHSINSPDNSLLWSYLCLTGPFKYVKVSLSPDKILGV